ncbi:MAG: redoxin domain-containing protein [Flavobacteriales bacterium]|nr:redoxin domain-containing protein [Flavobacteriales bacterium]
MKSAEELGVEAPEYVYDYTMVNQETGDERVITSKEYMDEKWWERKDWKLDKERTGKARKIKDGYEPPITDFSFQSEEGDEASYLFLENENPVLLVINYDVEKASNEMKEISTLSEACIAKGIDVFGLSASPMASIETFRHDYQLAFPYYQGDEKVLKTIVRANPGVLLLKDATILGKWPSSSLPTMSDLSERINNN